MAFFPKTDCLKSDDQWHHRWVRRGWVTRSPHCQSKMISISNSKVLVGLQMPWMERSWLSLLHVIPVSCIIIYALTPKRIVVLFWDDRNHAIQMNPISPISMIVQSDSEMMIIFVCHCWSPIQFKHQNIRLLCPCWRRIGQYTACCH